MNARSKVHQSLQQPMSYNQPYMQPTLNPKLRNQPKQTSLGLEGSRNRQIGYSDSKQNYNYEPHMKGRYGSGMKQQQYSPQMHQGAHMNMRNSMDNYGGMMEHNSSMPNLGRPGINPAKFEYNQMMPTPNLSNPQTMSSKNLSHQGQMMRAAQQDQNLKNRKMRQYDDIMKRQNHNINRGMAAVMR